MNKTPLTSAQARTGDINVQSWFQGTTTGATIHVHIGMAGIVRGHWFPLERDKRQWRVDGV